MVACCAHHVVDLVPILGLGGTAAFLINERIPITMLGIGVNSIGVAIAACRLIQHSNAQPPRGTTWTATPN